MFGYLANLPDFQVLMTWENFSYEALLKRNRGTNKQNREREKPRARRRDERKKEGKVRRRKK